MESYLAYYGQGFMVCQYLHQACPFEVSLMQTLIGHDNHTNIIGSHLLFNIFVQQFVSMTYN